MRSVVVCPSSRLIGWSGTMTSSNSSCEMTLMVYASAAVSHGGISTVVPHDCVQIPMTNAQIEMPVIVFLTKYGALARQQSGLGAHSRIVVGGLKRATVAVNEGGSDAACKCTY